MRIWIYSDNSRIIVDQYEKDQMLQREFRFGHMLSKIFRTKFEYVRSVTAIIDLLAIVPFFHEIRLLRIFILFRVFKLFRYAQSLRTFGSVLATKKFEFITLLMFASIVIFISSVLIYVMEANNPDSPIDTLFESFYWAVVTISTVGFGDITPVTDAGRFVAMIIIIAGVAVLSFTTSIIVSAFTENLDEIKDSYKRAVTTVILENQEKALREDRAFLNEAAPTNSTGASVDNWDCSSGLEFFCWCFPKVTIG